MGDPPRHIHILMIDDDDNILRTVRKDIEDSLTSNGIEPLFSSATTVESACHILETDPIDIAILDLRLESRKGDDGNSVMGKVMSTRVFPVIIYSAFTDDLCEDFRNHAFIYQCEKPNIEGVIDKIMEWERAKVFDLFTSNGGLSKSLSDTFQRTMWKHISRYWNFLPTDKPEMIMEIAGRIASTVLYDELLCSGNNGNLENPVHHGEMYIFSTPRHYFATGDIFRVGDIRYIVISPSCDLVFRDKGKANTDRILVAEIESLLIYLEKRHNGIHQRIIKGNETKEDIENIDMMMRHSYKNPAGRLFYLPRFGTFMGGVVDFAKIRVLDYSPDFCKDIMDTGRWEVALNREIVAEISSRFGKYSSRVGQPSYNIEYLVQTLKMQ